MQLWKSAQHRWLSQLLFVGACALATTGCSALLKQAKGLVPVDHFTYSTIASPQKAGVPFSLTITAYDAKGAVVKALNTDLSFTDTTGTLSPSKFTFSTGIATVSAQITKATPATAISAVAVPLLIPSDSSNTFAVIRGSLAQIGCETAASPQTAGVPFNIAFQAQDAFGNAIPTYSTPSNISVVSAAGGFTPPPAGGFAGGELPFNGLVLTVTGSNSLNITDPASGFSGTCALTVLPGALASITVSAPSSVQACVGFTTTVKAFDVYGNLKTDFNQGLSLVDTGATLSTSSPLIFSGGIANVTTQISAVGAETLTAQNLPPGAVFSAMQAVSVSAGPVTSFSFDPFIPPTACTVGTLTARARDSCGNLVTSFSGTMSLSLTQASGASPGFSLSPTTAAVVNGVATVNNVTLSGTASSVVIQGATNVLGTNFSAQTAPFASTLSANQTFAFDTIATQMACSTFPAHLRLVDDCGNTVTSGANANAVVTISENGGNTVSPTAVTLSSGQVSFTAQVNQAVGGAALKATVGAVTGTSNSFANSVTTTPSQIKISNIANATDCVNFTLNATAQDACGNTITGYNDTATWSVSAGSITPAAPVGTFVAGVFSSSVALSPTHAGVSLTLNAVSSGLSAPSNSFNVLANGLPYTFTLSTSLTQILQNGSETSTLSVASIRNSCGAVVPDGTSAVMSFNTANAVAVGGATQTSTGGATSFQFKGNNLGTTGNFQATVTIGGTPINTPFTLQNSVLVAPSAALSYRLNSPLSTPALADLTGGTPYTAGQITQVTSADANTYADITTPEAGWKNLSSDLYGGFGANHVSGTSNGLTGNAMTYASNIKKFVVFGGQDFSGAANYRANTYLFDPANSLWNAASSSQDCTANLFNLYGLLSSCGGSSPSARRNPALLYMPATGKVLLFGGWNGAAQSDTWEFNPVARTWASISPTTNPAARYGARVVYQSSTNSVLLFGGYDGTTYYNDLWRYTPSTQAWSAVSTSGVKPGPRMGAAGGITSDGRFYIFGGKGAVSTFNDTWGLISGSWTQVVTTSCTTSCANSPSGRAFAGSDLATSIGKLVIFGGASGSNASLADTWMLNTTTAGAEVWAQVFSGSNPNGSKDVGGFALKSGTSSVYFAGGLNTNGNYRTDVWTFNASTSAWQQSYVSTLTGCGSTAGGSELCSAIPYPRSRAALFATSATPVVPQIFGLLAGDMPGGKTNDQWKWDPTTTALWSSSGTLPQLDGSNTTLSPNPLSFMTTTGKVLRFGGRWNSGCTGNSGNDTWEYDPAALTWTQTVGAAGCGCAAACASSPPQATSDLYTLAYAPNSARALWIGGDAAKTWEYNPTAHTWASQAVSVGLRSRAKATYLTSSGKVLLYGGVVAGSVTGQTWEYDPIGHTWTQYTPAPNPGNRANYALAYSEITGNAYLFGGEDNSGTQYNDIWSYNPAAHTWTQVTGGCTQDCAGPVFRRNTDFVYSQQDGCLHLYGGDSNPSAITVYQGDHWRYCPTGNSRGTYLYHLHGFDLSAYPAQIATADSLALNFTGAGGGDNGNGAVFQVDFQVYSPSSGLFQDLGTINTPSMSTTSVTLSSPISNWLDGSNRIRMMITPGYPVGHSNGAGLAVDQSQLVLRYH